MARLRKKLRKTAARPAKSLPKSSPGGLPPDPGSEPDISRRRWVFRLGAILLPFLLLVVLELALRLAGYGCSTSFFGKAVVNGRECLVENPGFSRLFFPARLARVPPPFTLEAHKSPGTIRIFIFGESAAAGDPRPQLGAGRYLKALLQERFPETRFEIVNTAITAINSHAVWPIARECAAREGDFWIVYMGNNEMVGPFGAATVFGRQGAPLWFVRLNLVIQKLRLGQLLKNWSGSARLGGAELSDWGGMEMFLRNTISPSDNRKETVYRNFRRNLEDILRAGTGCGAKVVLSTVAVNLRDCPPFGSADDPSQSADAHFETATRLLAETNFASAKHEFELARDYDTLCFRADSRLNGIIAETGARLAQRGVVVCDAAGVLAASSPAQVPGQEYFYEHVHPTCEGNYRLALAWAGELAKLMPLGARQKENPAWADQARCEAVVGITDWNRVPVLQEVIERLRQPPLSTQPNNSNRVAILQNQVNSLRARMSPAEVSAARALYEAALRTSADDYMVHGNFAQFLEATGDIKEALAQRRLVAALAPQDYFSHLKLAMVLREQQELPGAEAALREAVRLKPDQDEVRLQLGAVYAMQKKFELALAEFDQARRLLPRDPRPLLFAGEALWQFNRPADSFRMLREAIKLKPDYVDAHYQLGEELALSAELPDAAAEFQEVLRLKPNHFRARLNLGVALSRMGRPQEALRQCDEALRLEPGNKQALQLRQQLLGQARAK